MISTIPLRNRGPLALTATWLADVFAALAAAARQRAEAAERRRQMRLTVNALRELDTRTLHDLGLHTSEISSAAYEASGAAEQIELTRARVWREIGSRIV